MKNLILLFSILALVSCKEVQKETQEKASEDLSEQSTTAIPETKKKPLSPHTSTMAMIGDAHIHIDYSSPGVRGRMIFGGLLAYDQVWQAGAHKATWIESNQDLIIAGQELKAGKYGFFLIPNQKEWTVIFNTNWDQHGKDDYEQKDDAIRFKVIPQILEESTEHLEYSVKKLDENSGTINMRWENVLISFPIIINSL